MDLPLLGVEDLQVEFATRRGIVQAVRGVSFEIRRGECLGLVGESGSGKSVTALTLIGLIHLPGRVTSGTVAWQGERLPADSTRLHRLRGRKIAMIFQDPMTSLNPLLPIGTQIAEVLRRHFRLPGDAAWRQAVELLDLVQIPSPDQRARQHPHELSGGMRQRVMIAIALACSPDLLIADEPTTALDVTIQAQILELIRDLKSRLGLSVLLITHDLGVVAGLCNRVAVMYAGRIVELAETEALFDRPGHPYTAGLLRSTPRLDERLTDMRTIEGAPPDLIRPPAACAFAERCPIAVARCRAEMPVFDSHPGGRGVACWRAFEPAWIEPTP